MMALNTNLHIISGSLGKDPTVRYGASGTCVCELSIATSHWDSQGEENITDWHKVILIGRQAEYVGEYGKKGSEISVTGRVQTRKWQDKNGQDRYTTETICFEAQLTRSNKENQEGQQASKTSQPNQYAQASGRRAAPSGAGFDDMDDELPPF